MGDSINLFGLLPKLQLYLNNPWPDLDHKPIIFLFKFTHNILWLTPPTMFSTRTVKALVLQDSKHPFIDRRNGNKWTCESDCSWSRIPNLVRKRAWAGIYRKRLKKKSIMALISTTIPSIRSPTHQLSILLSWERASWLWWPV